MKSGVTKIKGRGKTRAEMLKQTARVLVVDDEAAVCRFFEEYFTGERGLAVDTALNGAEANKLLALNVYGLAFIDLKLPDLSGIDLLEILKEKSPGCPAVIMTGHGSVESAVKAVKLGAFDYIEKPFDELEDLERVVNAALASAERPLLKMPGGYSDPQAFNMVGTRDGPLTRVLDIAGKIAKKNLTVLIHGPTGAGKEVLARYIHANSQRAEMPFIAVNCGAFSETLLESELFGHEKGAFTGASTMRRGIFEIADGGTLFLDEIGEANHPIQVKLLRTLETGEFTRVGGEKRLKSDVRIIAATNADLKSAVEKGTFRRDLFYRLDVVSLEVPPLKDRPADMEALIKHFLAKSSPEGATRPITLTREALEALSNYDWPGNVREMGNVIARAAALRSGDVIGLDLFPQKIAMALGKGAAVSPAGGDAETGLDVEKAVNYLGSELAGRVGKEGGKGDFHALYEEATAWRDRIMETALGAALEKCAGNRTAAAKLINAGPRSLRYFLKERRKRGAG